jgi:hypothetical protein
MSTAIRVKLECSGNLANHNDASGAQGREMDNRCAFRARHNFGSQKIEGCVAVTSGEAVAFEDPSIDDALHACTTGTNGGACSAQTKNDESNVRKV